MNADLHVDELAELYALGALDPIDKARVDDHIAQCVSCLRRVGEAEETVLALERVIAPVTPHAAATVVRRRPAWVLPGVAAAALIVGLLRPRPVSSPQNPALLAMIHSHFSHAQFTGAAGAPAAKVIYARDRSWLYVIVDGTHRFEVYGLDSGPAALLGETQPRGTTSDLYIESARSFVRVELREGDRTVEAAALR